MENYIMFEGKKIPLTDEQVEMLKNTGNTGKPEEVKKNPFERQLHWGDEYYVINECDSPSKWHEEGKSINRKHFAVANYCTDKELMEQRALHETLNRLLWRFSMKNGESENKWGEHNRHYFILMCINSGNRHFEICWDSFTKNEGVAYFPTKELAEEAITEIIEPFMEEHPDFVW